jgi:hypothetical protein
MFLLKKAATLPLLEFPAPVLLCQNRLGKLWGPRFSPKALLMDIVSFGSF